MNPEQRYTFGETDRAAERLDRLAELYRPTLVDFLKRATNGPEASSVRGDVRLALDLGSGPGHTTRTLASLLEAAHVVGLDRSARFVELASARQIERTRFVVHDVSALPFPTPRADFAYSRFLLTHLSQPKAVLGGWASVLRPGGRLLLQEAAELASDDQCLGRYYELVARLQAHYGQVMHIGRRLDELVDTDVFRIVDFRVTPLALPVAAMAELHLMNLETWRRDPFALAAFDASELDALAAELALIAAGRRVASIRQSLGELVLAPRCAD